MLAWQDRLNGDSVAWLLELEEPAVRQWITLRALRVLKAVG